jgi:hypothetical protein
VNFAGDGHGGDIVILDGTAEIVEDAPSATENEAWVTKYANDWERSGMTAGSYAQRFSIPVRIRISGLHGR